MRLRVRRLFVGVGASMWPGLGFHLVDGRRYPPILTAIAGGRYVYGRGFVVSVLGLQLWVTTDLPEAAL